MNVPGLIKAPVDEWLAMKREEAFELMFCANCFQMKNHINRNGVWTCGKCGAMKK